MRNLLILCILSCSLTMVAQQYNISKGFAADGYDVVAYFDGAAIAGVDQFVATHDEVNYKFSSQEHLDEFIAHPEMFIPQYGGYCAYAIAKSAKRVSVNPETFEIRDGKLYLFYNKRRTNTLELWVDESPDALVIKADDNWRAMNAKK